MKQETGPMPYVCLYGSYLEQLMAYSEAQRGRLVTAMLQYVYEGKQTTFKGTERFMWTSLRQQIDRDLANYSERCRRNRENGAKGGRPRKTEEITEGFSEEPKKPNEKENETEKENIYEKENEKENHKDKETVTENERLNEMEKLRRRRIAQLLDATPPEAAGGIRPL